MENENDIVTRLRWYVTNVHSDSNVVTPMQMIARDAAEEIERLRTLRDEWCSEFTKVRDAAKAMIEVDDMDALTDPDRAATDEYRAEVWANLRASVTNN